MQKEDLRKQANLRLLQRTCSGSFSSSSQQPTSPQRNPPLVLTDILATATHVVLYEFNATSQNWNKCNIEGSLFLATSSGSNHHHNSNNSTHADDNHQPHHHHHHHHHHSYRLIVLNRNSTDNFLWPVTQSLQLQHEPPFLILKNSNSSSSSSSQDAAASNHNNTILGIWFHNADERVAVHSVLQQTVDRLRSVPTNPTVGTLSSEAAAPPPPLGTTAVEPPTTVAPPEPLPQFLMSSPPPPPVTTEPPLTPEELQPVVGNRSSNSNSVLRMDPTATAMAAVSLKTVLGIADPSSGPTLVSKEHRFVDGADDQNRVSAAASPLLVSPQPQPHFIPASATTGTTTTTTTTLPALALDKKSLQLTLLSLLQDDRFIDLVHSQYLKVVRTRAAKQQQPPPDGSS